MLQVASVCRSSAKIADLESLLVVKISTKIRLHFVEFSRVIQIIHPFLQFLYLWSESLYLFHDFLSTSVQRICQHVILELSSFLPSRVCFGFEFLEELFSFMTISSCSRPCSLDENQHFRGRCFPNPVVEHKLVTEAHKYNCSEIPLCVPVSSVQISLEEASGLYFLQEEMLQHSLG